MVLEIERTVCGCDYGGTSWTTRGEAERVRGMLGLAPGIRFLDLGAGAGWPGLYLAQLSGCDAVLADIPVEGLRIAARRASRDKLQGVCWTVGADAAWLPFGGGTFDAIGHSDLLCCLETKAAVLAECRRVVRAAGIMVFTVIQIAPGLTPHAYRRATEAGPLFVQTTLPYPVLLESSGWRIAEHYDLTGEYARTVRSMVREEEARADILSALHGPAEFAGVLERRRRTVAALDDGLLRRSLVAAVPA